MEWIFIQQKLGKEVHLFSWEVYKMNQQKKRKKNGIGGTRNLGGGVAKLKK
jgi:hypothetical protein